MKTRAEWPSTSLLRWSVEGDAFNDRRCDSWWSPPVSLGQRQCVSADCSLRCGRTDRSTAKKSPAVSADNRLQDDVANALNWSRRSQRSIVEVAILNDLVADLREPSPTLVKLDSPAENV